MRVDRDAATVVGDGNEAVRLDLDLDPARMARHRLVHAVVDDLREQVVQALLVGAADIHAGPPADRLQPLQHLDVGGRIAVLGADRLLERHRLPAARGIGNGFQATDLLVELGEKVGGFVGLAFLWGGHFRQVSGSNQVAAVWHGVAPGGSPPPLAPQRHMAEDRLVASHKIGEKACPA